MARKEYNMNTIRKIMFDNDGVNIDSEDAAMRVMDDWGSDLVRRYQPNADLPQDYIYKTYPGTSTDRIVDALVEKFALPESKIREDYSIPEERKTGEYLADLITLETNEHFRKHLTAIPGATSALKEIQEMFGQDNICLATTSRADRMDVSLACAVDPDTGLNAGLENVYPKGELRRSGYGHANKYEEAFGATGWNPAETVVVEDSRSGVSKAKAAAAEVRVIGTVAAKFYEDKIGQAKSLIEDGARLVISNFLDLPNAVKWLDAGLDATQKPSFHSIVYTADSFDKVSPLISMGVAPAPSV